MTAVVPVGVDSLVASVSVVEQVGVHWAVAKVAVVSVGRPATENDTACGAPSSKVVVIAFAVEVPTCSDREPPFASEKSNGRVTVRLNVVVLVTPPPEPVTVTAVVPAGVAALVVSVSVVEQVGVHWGVEKVVVVPAGRPATENDTSCGAPSSKLVVRVFETTAPASTDRSPPFASVKSKGLSTVTLNVVVLARSPAEPVTVTAAVPSGVAVLVVIISVVEQVGVHWGAEKVALVLAGRPATENDTGCGVPSSNMVAIA
jgi:hypothetical protein